MLDSKNIVHALMAKSLNLNNLTNKKLNAFVLLELINRYRYLGT